MKNLHHRVLLPPQLLADSTTTFLLLCCRSPPNRFSFERFLRSSPRLSSCANPPLLPHTLPHTFSVPVQWRRVFATWRWTNDMAFCGQTHMAFGVYYCACIMRRTLNAQQYISGTACGGLSSFKLLTTPLLLLLFAYLYYFPGLCDLMLTHIPSLVLPLHCMGFAFLFEHACHGIC